ncbi:MAG: hypothetical protein ACYC0V_19430, partial [Armatimonadota bacterium]
LVATVGVLFYTLRQSNRLPISLPTVATNLTSSGDIPLMINVKGESGKLQSVDVISGKPVRPGIYADYGGYRVYFCCATSRSDFHRDAQDYLRAIKQRGILLKPTPSMGKNSAVSSGSVKQND